MRNLTKQEWSVLSKMRRLMGELETEDEAGQIVFYTNIVSREAFITQDNPQGYCMAEADDDIYND